MTKVIAGPGAAEDSAELDSPARREIFNARRAIVVAILSVLALVGLSCRTEREQIHSRENERAENLARAFEFHVHHEIQNVDDLLRQLRKMRLDTAPGFHEAVSELRAGELGQRSIQFGLVDARGYLKHSTAGENEGRTSYVGDREYFKAHLDQRADRLFISRLTAGDGGRNSILFSRRYADAGGRLLGVVLISMPAGFLTDGARALGLRPNDVATILRQDGFLLSRIPVMPDPSMLAERLPAGFLANFDGRDTGLFEETSPLDQVRRLIAFRKTTEFPVTSIVGPATRNRDVELRQAAWRHLSLAGLVVALLLTFHFFHERSLRRNEALRREHERERRHLSEAQAIANLGSWRLNVADHTLYWSDEVYRIFGLTPGGAALTYDDFLSRVHPDDRLALDAAFGRAREDGTPYDIRHRIVRPDGSVRHVIQRGQLEFDSRGLVDQFTGTVQDVTVALEAEVRQLDAARSDRLARAVFDGVLQPMLVLSAEGRLIDVNPAFEEMFALAGVSLRGRLLAELENTPAGAQAFANHPSRLFQVAHAAEDLAGRLQGEWEGDVVVVRDGRERVLSLTLSGIRDADGKIEHYVGIYTDVTQRKRREDSARHQAHHDPLTGLANRKYAMDRITRSLHRARRKRMQGVLVFIDLDRFKEINDRYGHEAGDEVLRVIGKRFLSVIRQEDMLARLGGDEFVVLIEEVANVEVVRRVAEALRAAAIEPVTYSGALSLGVSASLGVAVFPRPDEDAASLLARADQAMYEAKRDGRDAVRFCTTDFASAGEPFPNEGYTAGEDL